MGSDTVRRTTHSRSMGGVCSMYQYAEEKLGRAPDYITVRRRIIAHRGREICNLSFTKTCGFPGTNKSPRRR